MIHSEKIDELGAALAKAQGQIEGAKKDSANPFFKSKYADLASVWDACRKHLSENGLSVTQCPEEAENGISIETMLLHSSGQWIKSRYTMPVSKIDAQAVGSAITYARRYALASIVGVAPEDDDGNAAAISKHGKTELPLYADEQIAKNINSWQDAITSGKTTAEKIIAKISSGYRLTEEQKDRIKAIKKLDEFLAEMEAEEKGENNDNA